MFVNFLVCSRTQTLVHKVRLALGSCLKKLSTVFSIWWFAVWACALREVFGVVATNLFQVLSTSPCYGMNMWVKVVCPTWVLGRSPDIAGWFGRISSTTQLGISKMHSSHRLGKGRSLGKEGEKFQCVVSIKIFKLFLSVFRSPIQASHEIFRIFINKAAAFELLHPLQYLFSIPHIVVILLCIFLCWYMPNWCTKW